MHDTDETFKKMDRCLENYLFMQREESFVHATLNEELSGMRCVSLGDIEGTKKYIKSAKEARYPSLSDDPVQSEKYLFVASITTCCRMCIEKGMPSDESYGLSDLYIRKADKLTDAAAVEALKGTMLLDYAMRMKDYRKEYREYSPKIIAAMNYISNHLHDRITVRMVADELEMNASWLSTCFAKETGLPLSEYIRNRKLEAAKYLLAFNDYSCTDIAEYLGFSGESHFSSLFTAYEGCSPREYKKKNYRKQISQMEANPDVKKNRPF